MINIKRRDFSIDIETLVPHETSYSHYRGYTSTAGTYRWKVIEKASQKVIGTGKCVGKNDAKVEAYTFVTKLLKFNPSMRDSKC